MADYRKILRLHHEGYSQRSIASICRSSRNTVSKTIDRFDGTGLGWPLPEGMTDQALAELLLKKGSQVSTKQLPDFDSIHKELAKPGVTLSLLWEEYLVDCRLAGKDHYMYSQFCELYRSHAAKSKATMRIQRNPGEALEVDWAGQTAHIVDNVTGELIKAYVFVAAFPFSRYAYVEAFLSMNQEAWISAHVRAFQYFGGVARTLVPDNLKTGVSKSSKNDPVINRVYQEMAEHYDTIVIPARVRKPKDKASVEGEVGVVSTWILAALRNCHCFSIGELNREILGKLGEYNDKPFQKRTGSRRSVFLAEEKPLLVPLPVEPFVMSEWKVATVQFNYHIALEKMNYSVPYEYIRHKVDVRSTSRTVEIFYKGTRIASHIRLKGLPNQYSTVEAHMPAGHYEYARLSGQSLRNKAAKIGPSTEAVIDCLLRSAGVEQQAFKSCLGLLKLGDKYGTERLEAACRLSRELTRRPSYKSIALILKNGSDKAVHSLPLPLEKHEPDEFSLTRGSGYYGGDGEC